MIDNITYINNEHKSFYIEKMKKITNDSYHKALVYLLGLTAETRNNFNTLVNYDGKYSPCSLSIKPENINAPWQTGTTYKITRLAYNLFNGFSYDYEISEEGEKLKQFSKEYTPYNLFCNSFAPYFFQAIMIRYTEYCRNIEMNIYGSSK